MEKKQTLIKIITSLVFLILIILGVLFLIAAPANPSLTVSRLIIGTLFIVFGIIIFALGLITANKKYTIVSEGIKSDQKAEETVQEENITLICQNCKKAIRLNEKLYDKDTVICERCGESIQVPKDKLKW